jgi:hypothetical protein
MTKHPNNTFIHNNKKTFLCTVNYYILVWILSINYGSMTWGKLVINPLSWSYTSNKIAATCNKIWFQRMLHSRLLARILKEAVQFWYNETFWSLRYFMSVFVPSSFEIFQTHLALWVCAAMLLYLTTTFSFSQVHHQSDQNVKCIIIMRIEAISFQIY